MNTYVSFETQHLILRATTEEDAEFMLELMNSPKWLMYVGDRNVKSIEDAASYINRKIKPQFENLGYSNYTVIRKSDEVKMGTCGLFDREGLEGIDIGFAFLPEYEKMGYAFEASRKMKELAFEKFGIDKICAITTKENISSQRLLEKLGLQFIRIVRIPNDEEDLMLYEINK